MPPIKNRKKNTPPLIAHVIFRLGTGGLENGLVNLVNGLPKDQFRHVIICMTDFTAFKERINRDDVNVFCLHKKEGKDFAVYYRLWVLLSKLKPEVLHTRNLSALEAQWPGYLAGIRCRIHGEHGRDMDDLDGKNRKHRLLRRLFRHIVQHYVPMSQNLETWLVRDIKVAPARISQIYNGVDIGKFTPADPKPRAVLPESFRDERLTLIGTVGRQVPVKDPLTLLCAYIRLHQQHPDLAQASRLILVGDGVLHSTLMEKAVQAGISDSVWLPGDRPDINTLMQTLDVFVLPSRSEGISNTILEAMASGLPVIATRVGGNPELVADQKSGFLVEQENPEAITQALLFYLEHPVIRQQHGAAGRQICTQHFSLQRMLHDYTQVYERVLASYG